MGKEWVLKILEENFDIERIYNISDIEEKFDKLEIKSSDIEEIILWWKEALDILVNNKNYWIILKNTEELQKLVNFILENKDKLKNTEIKDREKILINK